MAAKDLEKLNLNDRDPGIRRRRPVKVGFAFASAPAGAPKEGFSFNLPPAPAADDDDDDEMKLPAAVLGECLGYGRSMRSARRSCSEYVKKGPRSKRSIGEDQIPSSKTEQESSTGSWSPPSRTTTSRP